MKTTTKERPKRELARAVAVVLLAAGLAGCSGHVSSRTDINVNGHRKVTQVLNGITRTLETRQAVVFQAGKIVEFPPGTVVQLSEKQGQRTRTAELREHGGKLELWMKVDGAFRQGTAEEQTWLDNFLQALQIDDGGKKRTAPDRKGGIVQDHPRRSQTAATGLARSRESAPLSWAPPGACS